MLAKRSHDLNLSFNVCLGAFSHSFHVVSWSKCFRNSQYGGLQRSRKLQGPFGAVIHRMHYLPVPTADRQNAASRRSHDRGAEIAWRKITIPLPETRRDTVFERERRRAAGVRNGNFMGKASCLKRPLRLERFYERSSNVNFALQ